MIWPQLDPQVGYWILGSSGLLGAGCGLIAWRASRQTPALATTSVKKLPSGTIVPPKRARSRGDRVLMLANILIAIGFFSSMAGLIVMFYGNKIRAVELLTGPPIEEPSASRTLSDGRIVVGASPRYLTNLYQVNTSATADKIAAPYIGNWIEIPGAFDNVRSPIRDFLSSDPTAMRTTVTLVSRRWWPVMFFRFDAKRWQRHLETLSKNQELLFRCRIESISAGDMEFNSCEILDPTTREVISNAAQ